MFSKPKLNLAMLFIVMYLQKLIISTVYFSHVKFPNPLNLANLFDTLYYIFYICEYHTRYKFISGIKEVIGSQRR